MQWDAASYWPRLSGISVPVYTVNKQYRGGTTWTGDFKCREVKTGFCRKISMQTGSSETLIGWKSGQTTFVPLWDQMEGSWLWTLYSTVWACLLAEIQILLKTQWLGAWWPKFGTFLQRKLKFYLFRNWTQFIYTKPMLQRCIFWWKTFLHWPNKFAKGKRKTRQLEISKVDFAYSEKSDSMWRRETTETNRWRNISKKRRGVTFDHRHRRRLCFLIRQWQRRRRTIHYRRPTRFPPTLRRPMT